MYMEFNGRQEANVYNGGIAAIWDDILNSIQRSRGKQALTYGVVFGDYCLKIMVL